MLDHDSMFDVMLAVCPDRPEDTDAPTGYRTLGVSSWMLEELQDFPFDRIGAMRILKNRVIDALELEALNDHTLAWVLYTTAIDDGYQAARDQKEVFQELVGTVHRLTNPELDHARVKLSNGGFIIQGGRLVYQPRITRKQLHDLYGGFSEDDEPLPSDGQPSF